MAQRSSRDDEAELVYRVGRVGNQYDIAGCCDGLRHVGEAFFRPKRCNNLRVRVQLHAKSPFIICSLRASKAGNPARSRITVSYTHLRAHETVLDLVCRLLLE